MNSKQKGARGERELASKLREYGYKAIRSQQYCGANNDADLITNMDGLWIECKRVEALNLTKAMLKAKSEATEGDIPVVCHRKNHEDWYITINLDDFLREIYPNWK
jgi:Holliday junction resolvase